MVLTPTYITCNIVLKLSRSFIVWHVIGRMYNSCGFELLLKCKVSFYHFFCCLIFHWLCVNDITVNLTQTHNLFLPYAWCDKEFSHLIPVHCFLLSVHPNVQTRFFSPATTLSVYISWPPFFVDQILWCWHLMCPFCVSLDSGTNVLTVQWYSKAIC